MVLVSGYYGFDNAGDEGVLAALCNDLVACGVKRELITVLSGNPSETYKAHGVQAIPRFNFWAIYQALLKNKLLISGGGSLLQDSSSWRTIPYYLGIIRLAKFLGLKVLIYGQGIGPVNNQRYRYLISKVLQKVDGITLRDQHSADLLIEWGVPSQIVSVAADPVFSLPLDQSPEQGITLNLRPYSNWTQDLSGWVELISSWFNDCQWEVTYVPLGPGDLEIGQILKTKIPQLVLENPVRWDEAALLMSSKKYAVSMRLHGMIFAALGGSLPIGLCYDPKVKHIADQLQIIRRETSPSSQLTTDLLTLQERELIYAANVAEQINRLKAKTQINRTMLKKHLHKLALEEKNEG